MFTTLVPSSRHGIILSFDPPHHPPPATFFEVCRLAEPVFFLLIVSYQITKMVTIPIIIDIHFNTNIVVT